VSAQAPSEVSGSSSIDLRYYLRVLLKRKWLILLVFALVVGGTTLWARSQPKVYAAQISLIIDSKEPRFLDNQIQDVNNDSTTAYWANKEYIETQSKIITSRAVSQRVVEKLGLNTDAEFLGLTKIPEPQRAELMKNIDSVARVQAKIKVESLKDSRVNYIKIEDGDPNRAALLANEVAQAYIDEALAQKLKVTENASKWLDERRDSLSESAKTSEMALYAFRKQSDMLSTSIDDRANMVSARLTATSQALTDAQLKIAGLKARVAAIRNVQAQNAQDSMWAEALPAARENQTLQKLKDRMLALRTECTELQSRYLESHPKLMECRDKLTLVEKDFQRELSNLVVGSEAELREAVERERNLLALFNEVKVEAFEVEKKKLELDRLKQESDSAKRQYDSVFKRLKDIELSGLLRTSNVRVLDAARPSPAPVRPNVPQSILLGVLAGLIAGLGLALLLEFLDSSVTSQMEIEERLGLTFLGFVPTIPQSATDGQSKDLHIYREPKSHIAECTRAVRTNLLFMSPDKPLKRMLVTSSGPQEGKSTTAINLAIAMAQSGQKVLIVDTDMRRPRLHKAFGVPNDVGVSSLVVGEGKLEDAIKTTEVPGVYLLPCGPVPPNPAELLHTKAFGELLETLDGKFDRVLLDSPPVGAVADAVVLATQVAGVVMVLKAGVTHRDVAKRTVRALNDVKATILGAVLNDVTLERSRYGDYSYGYAYRYYGYGDKNG
jgi:capsular exopolysaccharide synthesis family protein